jgi:hypothetical protein
MKWAGSMDFAAILNLADAVNWILCCINIACSFLASSLPADCLGCHKMTERRDALLLIVCSTE